MEKRCQILIKKHKNDVSVLLTWDKKMKSNHAHLLYLTFHARLTNTTCKLKKKTEKETKQQLTR